jgi:farnesyl diphosphate synthase
VTTDNLLDSYLRDRQQRVEKALEARLPAQDIAPARLHCAMHYAVMGGGKRFRPVLVYAVGEALGVAPERLDPIACAIECIHAYSLIHDDLPAMDDDDLRRGRPTCHKAFDEATAILAGDALQSFAFHLLISDPTLTVAAERRLAMVDHLAVACGSRGMAGGQVMDLAAEGQELNLAELESLHIHKTGALIRACAHLAALASDEVDEPRAKALDHYAKCLGLAFQVQDDILDVVGDVATLGKTQGKDEAANKATYPALMGLEESRRLALELRDDAIRCIESFGEAAEPLRWLAEYVVSRKS